MGSVWGTKPNDPGGLHPAIDEIGIERHANICRDSRSFCEETQVFGISQLSEDVILTEITLRPANLCSELKAYSFGMRTACEFSEPKLNPKKEVTQNQ